MKQKKGVIIPILFLLSILIIIVISKIPLISINQVTPYEVLPNSKVGLLNVVYSEISPSRIHGILEIKYSTNLYLSGTVFFVCPITAGEVRQEEVKTYLYCKESEIKNMELGDNKYTLNLISGTYFVDLVGDASKSNIFPAKVIIHKGEISTFTIPLN